MPLIRALTAAGVLGDQLVAYGEHAVGVALAVDVGAVGELHGALHVGEERGAVGLDGRDDVEGAGAEGLHGLRGRAHVADRDVLEGDAVLLQPVVGQHLQRIELEGAERLALELLRAVEAGLGDQHAALDAAARHDLHRGARVVEGHEARIRHHAGIDLAHAEEGDLIREGRGVHEVDGEAVILGELHRLGQEEVEVAEAGPVGRPDAGGRRGAADHARAHRQGECGGGAAEEAPAAGLEPREVGDAVIAVTVAHIGSPQEADVRVLRTVRAGAPPDARGCVARDRVWWSVSWRSMRSGHPAPHGLDGTPTCSRRRGRRCAGGIFTRSVPSAPPPSVERPRRPHPHDLLRRRACPRRGRDRFEVSAGRAA